MPYEGFETAEDLSTQDIKRVVLKAFRREKAWSQSSAAPIAVKTCKFLQKTVMGSWLQVVTSDLVALFNGRKFIFFRPSDLSSVDVYEFPRVYELPGFFTGEYDHESNTFVVFAPTVQKLR